MADEPETEEEAEEADAEATSAAIPGLGTPEGERLREALHAFDAGDYVQVRAITGALATSKDDAIRDAASALAERIAIDPIQIVVLGSCAAALFAIIYIWIL